MSESQKTYDQAKAFAVLDRLEEEPHLGLSEILRQAGIPRATFRDWRNQYPDLKARYEEAKEIGFDNLAQQCLEISDDGASDYIATDKGEVFDSEHVQRSKLKIDTRLKLLAKWYPKKYGDRTVLAGDPDAPLRGLSDEELDAKLATFLEKHGNG